MLERTTLTLAFVLLIAATTAQNISYDIKALQPNPKTPKGSKQNPQHPDGDLYAIVGKLPNPSSRETDEHYLGSYEKNGAVFKNYKRNGEMSIYLEKVEGTFAVIYYEQEEAESSALAAEASALGEVPTEDSSPRTAPPPTRALEFVRTITAPVSTTRTSKYRPANHYDACNAWISLIRYCGTAQTSAKSLSECYCTSDSYPVPDQWNSLAARCADAKYECTASTDYLCDLTDHASSSTAFCKTDGKTVRFHTKARSTIERHTSVQWMGEDYSDTEGSTSSNDEDDEDETDQDSTDDFGTEVSSEDLPPEQSTAQPKSTSSADQVPWTTSDVYPGSTRNTHTSGTSSSISFTLPSATSTSSAQSLAATLNGLVFRIAQTWLLAVCVLWML